MRGGCAGGGRGPACRRTERFAADELDAFHGPEGGEAARDVRGGHDARQAAHEEPHFFRGGVVVQGEVRLGGMRPWPFGRPSRRLRAGLGVRGRRRRLPDAWPFLPCAPHRATSVNSSPWRVVARREKAGGYYSRLEDQHGFGLLPPEGACAASFLLSPGGFLFSASILGSQPLSPPSLTLWKALFSASQKPRART